MPKPRKRIASKKKNRISWIRTNLLRIRTNTSPIFGIAIVVLGGALLLLPSAYKNVSRLHLNSNVQFLSLKPASNKTSNSSPIKIDSRLLSKTERTEPPSRIVVPSLSVDLPIVEAKVVNGFWELSETSASHGVGSANPGENGNIVVFAHAREDLFGPMRNVKKDTIIYVLTKDHWFKYQVKDTKLVDPNDVQVISATDKETLTLYTCDGFLDSKRLIVDAKPV